MSTSSSPVDTAAAGPLETTLRAKLTAALSPARLDVTNESHLHAGHSAMRGVANKETHFRVHVVSDAFQGKSPLQRHRTVYGLLTDEMSSSGHNGIHALALSTKTPAEIEAVNAAAVSTAAASESKQE
ncbi:bola-domain-containing protein [Ramicandelaber brevisporus]|nr:bola-domain-containing protein [Ramicandelaber brevisporus]